MARWTVATVDWQQLVPRRNAAGEGQAVRLQEALRVGIADSVGRMVVRAESPAIQLSGGLDSGAVAWGTSQAHLPSGAVAGYCSVPVHDTQAAWPAEAVANELPLAEAIGRMTGVDPVRAVPAAGVSVLDGIRWMLDTRLEPSIGAGNMYWISTLLRETKARGHDLILTGQQGNGTISWYGRPWSRSFGELWRHRSPAGAVQHKLLRPLLARMGRDGVNRWRIGSEPWLAGTLIRPEFARKVHLREYIAEEAYGFWFHSFEMDPRIDRWRVIEPTVPRGRTLGRRRGCPRPARPGSDCHQGPGGIVAVHSRSGMVRAGGIAALAGSSGHAGPVAEHRDRVAVKGKAGSRHRAAAAVRHVRR